MTCKSVREEVNPTSFLWLLFLGVVLPIIGGDNYYTYLGGIIIAIVTFHFIMKFKNSLKSITEYSMYREMLSFIILVISMIVAYGTAIYNIKIVGELITVCMFLWVIPPLITGVSLITPPLIDLILLGEIKNEKDFT